MLSRGFLLFGFVRKSGKAIHFLRISRNFSLKIVSLKYTPLLSPPPSYTVPLGFKVIDGPGVQTFHFYWSPITSQAGQFRKVAAVECVLLQLGPGPGWTEMFASPQHANNKKSPRSPHTRLPSAEFDYPGTPERGQPGRTHPVFRFSDFVKHCRFFQNEFFCPSCVRLWQLT